MKKIYKIQLITFVLILLFSSVLPNTAFADSSEYDFANEKIKPDSSFDLNIDEINDVSSEYYYIEEKNDLEYRIADEEAAKLLSALCKQKENEINSSHYYDITVSFEKADRIEAMYKMLEFYDNITNDEKEVFSSYLLSYAPYAEDDNLLKQVNNKVLSVDELISTCKSSNYDRLAAATWAYDNYNLYNSNFPDLRSLGGDCANFVSQAMHVGGGMAMSNDWYCYKLNNVYPKPTTAQELDYSWSLASPSPWISAKEFKNYWSSSSRSTTYTYDLSDYKNGNTSAFSDPILKGHAISLLKKVAWWYEAKHTMIVVGYDYSNSDYIFAAHSGPTRTGKVKNVGNYDKVRFYVFK